MSEDPWLKRAETASDAARILFDVGHYEAAVSRAYYTMFYGALALLASKGLTASTHRGVHAQLNEYFVKAGILETGYGVAFKRAEEERRLADYTPIQAPGKETAERLIASSESFLSRCRELLNQ